MPLEEIRYQVFKKKHFLTVILSVGKMLDFTIVDSRSSIVDTRYLLSTSSIDIV